MEGDEVSRRERPIIFSGPMVRAILLGRKTQARRIVRADCQGYQKLRLDEQGLLRQGGMQEQAWTKAGRWVRCPYGKAGDLLWVREKWAGESVVLAYGADGESFAVDSWRSPVQMPRWASRLTLEILSVRVERLQDISEEDILAEGVTVDRVAEWTGTPWSSMPTLADAWRVLWDSINGERAPWSLNPWTWILEFRRMEAGA